MPRKHFRRIDARAYQNYTTQNLDQALKNVLQGKMTLRKASKQFSIPLGTLSHKLRNKRTNSIGRPLVFSADEENSFVDHLIKVAEWGFPFNTLDLRMMASAYLNIRGRTVPCFKNNIPSSDWALAFLNRHRAKISRRMGRNISISRASLSAETVKQYFDNLTATLLNDDGTEVSPTTIFNYDETNLSDDPGQKKCIFKRGVKYTDRVRSSTKSSISIMFCGSACGSMLSAYVVYKAEHIWSTWTEGGPPNTRYNRSKSGWFDIVTFSDWFETVFVPHVKNIPGKKVLIGDNLSSHFSERVLKLAQENDIAFTCLPANGTHLLQPLDIAFYGPLKRYWRNVLDFWKSSSKKKSQTLSKDQFPRLLTKLYEKLYSSVADTSNNLTAGLRKCGIYPLNPTMVMARLPDGICDQSTEKELAPNAVVSEAVVSMLKEMRGVDEPVRRQRKRRINVVPGKSISAFDLLLASSSTQQQQSQKSIVEEDDNGTSSDEDVCALQ
ncbi:uncharacterized protein LOC134538924 [Bacillus rossius redtenbacheri]|uniref:uncharacterized protein LOC134529425 n=1 Tax=Bacillus rossius redtenbacheri TaxID=93214 RepID=UPI002FDE76FE